MAATKEGGGTAPAGRVSAVFAPAGSRGPAAQPPERPGRLHPCGMDAGPGSDPADEYSRKGSGTPLNRYKRLFSTTFILGVGTFSSKLLVFFLMPLYTRVLTDNQYGTVDLLVQTGNFLIPLVSLGINNAVMRFGMDGETDRRSVFTTGLAAILISFGVFLLLYPLVNMVPGVAGYAFWIYLFVFCSMLRSLCAQFVKSLQLVRLYAFNGVLGTATTLLFDILFLVAFRLGVVGYLLAIICSDLVSLFLLFIVARLYRYIRLQFLRREVVGKMLRFSLPLIPTNVFWWITDVSDRYLVTWMIGSEANGLYAVSYKIPTVIITLVGIFMDAWQISILTEKGALARRKFFAKVFSMYQSVVFVSASALIVFAKVITRILVSDAFYESWRYIPLLILATCFSSFVTFFGTIYMVEKKSVSTLVTTILGAVLNIIGNILLIPVMGVQGAALSTCLSYAAVFLVRVIDTHRLISFRWNVARFMLNLIIVSLQSWILLAEPAWWVLWEALLLALVVLVNGKTLLRSVQKVLG